MTTQRRTRQRQMPTGGGRRPGSITLPQRFLDWSDGQPELADAVERVKRGLAAFKAGRRYTGKSKDELVKRLEQLEAQAHAIRAALGVARSEGESK